MYDSTTSTYIELDHALSKQHTALLGHDLIGIANQTARFVVPMVLIKCLEAKIHLFRQFQYLESIGHLLRCLYIIYIPRFGNFCVDMQ